MRIRYLLGLLFLAVPPALHAQGTCPTLEAGSTVHLRSPSIARASYTLPRAVQPADSAILLPSTGRHANTQVRCADLQRVQLRVGTASRVQSGLRGAGIGLLIGGVAGAVLGYADWRESDEFQLFSRNESMLLGAVVLGSAGAAGGGVIGYALPGSRWRDVPVTSRPGRASAEGLRIALAGGSQVRVSYTLPL
jgi:hypothetical protein